MLVELPVAQTEARVVASAEERGLALEGLASYAVEESGAKRGPSLVVGYGTPADHEYTAAVARLTATHAQGEEPTLE